MTVSPDSTPSDDRARADDLLNERVLAVLRSSEEFSDSDRDRHVALAMRALNKAEELGDSSGSQSIDLAEQRSQRRPGSTRSTRLLAAVAALLIGCLAAAILVTNTGRSDDLADRADSNPQKEATADKSSGDGAADGTAHAPATAPPPVPDAAGGAESTEEASRALGQRQLGDFATLEGFAAAAMSTPTSADTDAQESGSLNDGFRDSTTANEAAPTGAPQTTPSDAADATSGGPGSNPTNCDASSIASVVDPALLSYGTVAGVGHLAWIDQSDGRLITLNLDDCTTVRH